MKQNITVSLDATTLQRAKKLAAQRNLSVSKLLAADLAEQVDAEQRYDQARRQALAWLKHGTFDLGGKYPGRDEVHER
ncbi:DUF6364 family protein [Pseudothauera rhizosphaerae]|uniref:CopG family transcriptional regulator n=1 Tax=Pseudothauera rhizosphaerae TaxID=2565932 RepID=A0A4S4B0V8_9RHOO|nr:DUF6364 family protein [Pseudothauera rhizosphaerae]THF65274.1 hypothetical protein E6O51_01345 [Pseudothauera rhizosphaerae]